LAFGFLWPAVLGGRVLLPADLIFDIDPLWRPLAPQGYTYPSNRILSDQVYMYFPWKVFTAASFAQGFLPLWNPFSNGGQPFVGNAQSAIFSPFSLVGYLLPLHTSYVVTAILRLAVAGLFTFLFAREIGLGRHAALLAAIAFTFSGPMVVWLGYPLSPVVVWLPAMLLTIERALRMRSGLYAIVCGVTIGAQFLGGHPETSFHVLLTWGAYALYRTIALEGRLAPQLLRAASAAVLGTLLAAVQLIPFVEALLHSAILVARQAEATVQPLPLLTRIFAEWQQWPTMITATLPLYFGNPYDGSYLYPYSNFVEQNVYVGVIPLALAGGAAYLNRKQRQLRQRSLILFFLLLAVVSVGVAVRLPLLNGVNYLPLFNITVNRRLRLIYAFAIAILGGFGLDGIVTRDLSFRTLSRIVGVIALTSLALIALAYAGFVVFEDQIIRLGRDFVDREWGTPYYSRPIEYYYTQVTARYEKRLASFRPDNAAMYLPVIIPIAWLAFRKWGSKLRILAGKWAYVPIGLTVLDLFVVGMPVNPAIDREDVYPTPDVIAFLQADSDVFRICATGLILYPNSNMVFGISDIRGYETTVARRFADVVDRVEGHQRLGITSLLTGADSRLLDLLNVKYLLTDRELTGKWELVHQGEGRVDVYRNSNVLPRAFVVHQAEIVESPARSLDRVADSGFDFRTRVVLEEPAEGWAEPSRTSGDGATVRFLSHKPNRVVLDAETSTDGLLVLTDTASPGWKARVDGQPTRIYVANHAFRAVVVSAGKHRVEFEYQPAAFWFGAALSLLALITVVSWLVLVWSRRYRRSRQ
jgi:hypothetical protein